MLWLQLFIKLFRGGMQEWLSFKRVSIKGFMILGKKDPLFPEMRVTRKIFTRAAADLFF